MNWQHKGSEIAVSFNGMSDLFSYFFHSHSDIFRSGRSDGKSKLFLPFTTHASFPLWLPTAAGQGQTNVVNQSAPDIPKIWQNQFAILHHLNSIFSVFSQTKELNLPVVRTCLSSIWVTHFHSDTRVWTWREVCQIARRWKTART